MIRNQNIENNYKNIDKITKIINILDDNIFMQRCIECHLKKKCHNIDQKCLK